MIKAIIIKKRKWKSKKICYSVNYLVIYQYKWDLKSNNIYLFLDTVGVNG